MASRDTELGTGVPGAARTDMGIIDGLLQRIGLVRIARYGLVVTPEDRIRSLRPSVLDDGSGGKIVGWTQGDLAAMELESWPPAPVVVAPVAVAPMPEVEDDDWEWIIAVARAKAEETEVIEEVSAVMLLPGPATAPMLVPSIGDDTAVDTLAVSPRPGAYVGRAPIAAKPRPKGPTVVPLRPAVHLDPISRRPIRIAR